MPKVNQTTTSEDGFTAATVQERLPVPGLWVIAAPEDHRGGAWIAVGEGVEVGRGTTMSSGNALLDRTMSSRHAAASVLPDGRLRVRDLGSRNGTWFRGDRVTEATLSPGEVVRLGGTFLQYFADIAAIWWDEPADGVSAQLEGPSPEMRGVRRHVRELGPLAVDVLVLGAPGVGKERAAAALHAASGRTGRFEARNCAAIPAQLAESELFGHVKGAFTGANAPRDGAFVAANGGTLFLDEVGDLPLEVQPKLLRALQEGEVRPVGGNMLVRVSVRVVSATNRDLGALVQGHRMRPDLYSRLAGAVIEIPPLWRRPADIVALAHRFLGPGRTLHPTAVDLLLRHPWPNNARDLRHVMALCAGAPSPVMLTDNARAKMAADLRILGALATAPEADSPPPDAVVPWPEDEPARRALLAALLAEHHGNVSLVARLVGRRLTSIRRWLRSYGIRPEEYRD